MTNSPEPEANSAVKVMTVLFGALLAGQIVFLVVIFVLHTQGFEFIAEGTDIFIYVGIFVLLLGIGASTFLYKSLLKTALSESDVSSRIARHNAAILVRLALLEGPNLANLVFYLLTGENLFLLLFAFGLGAFILARPDRDTFLSNIQRPQAASID